jgi:hypothetical protein
MFTMAPLISMTVTLMVFLMLMTCLMMRPSARRTILLTTILGEKEEKKSKRKKSPKQEAVNPIYMWMVQPKEETGLKEGNRQTISKV